MEFLIIFLVAVAVVCAVIRVIFISSKKMSMTIKLSRLGDFSSSQKVIGADGNSGISIDEEREKVCLINNRIIGNNADVLSYRDILSRRYSKTVKLS